MRKLKRSLAWFHFHMVLPLHSYKGVKWLYLLQEEHLILETQFYALSYQLFLLFPAILQYITARHHPNQCIFYSVFTGSLVFLLPPLPINDYQYKTTFRECKWILALNLKETTVWCTAADQNKHNQKTISLWRFKNKSHVEILCKES